MRGLILVLMSNVCYLAVILNTAWYGYCSLLLVSWWLLVVTARYRLLLLVPTSSMNEICHRIDSTVAVISDEQGHNADIFVSIFYADTLGFSVAIQAKLEMEIQFVVNVPYPT